MRIPSLALLAALVTSPTFAQTDLSEMKVSDLVNSCAVALGDGQDVTDFAAELISRSKFSLGTQNIYDGAACLESVFGEKFNFRNNRFESPSIIAFQKQAIEQQAAAKKARELAYLSAVINACNEEYGTDSFRALTTPICGDVFKAQGLPD